LPDAISVTTSFDVVQDLLRRVCAEGTVLRLADGSLFLLDPAAIAKANGENFKDLPLPPRLRDVILLRDESTAVTWSQVRAAFGGKLKQLMGENEIAALNARMREGLEQAAGRSIDLTHAVERIIVHALAPIVISGLSPRGERAVLRDIDFKLDDLLKPVGRDSFGERVAALCTSAMAGLAVARELRRRASGRAPVREDLAQEALALVQEIGLSRAAYVVTTLLTAIAGAPGSVAACLLYELKTRPYWDEALRSELSAIEPQEFFTEGVRAAPLTQNFVREVLRMWSFPLLVRREARKDLDLLGRTLPAGGFYYLSSYVAHRFPDYWHDPDRFDPDRWRSDPLPGSYTPFGWGPRGCIGAALGLIQLMLFCRLVTVDYDIRMEPGSAAIGLQGIAVPRDFRGMVSRRCAGTGTSAMPVRIKS
jgi:cytochrome P450